MLSHVHALCNFISEMIVTEGSWSAANTFKGRAGLMITATPTKFTAGCSVKIYYDPITEKELEGWFVLYRHIRSTVLSSAEQLERWQGKFEGDEVPFERVFKTSRI